MHILVENDCRNGEKLIYWTIPLTKIELVKELIVTKSLVKINTYQLLDKDDYKSCSRSLNE